MSDFPGTYVGEPAPRTMLLEGPFGTGKTTYAIDTLFAWLQAGIPPEDILVLVPQRTLAERYFLALRDIDFGPTGTIEVRTISGLARDMVNLYWPYVASSKDFKNPESQPRFLTIETAQYAMGEFVDAAVQDGQFDAINVTPHQIARQIIDNLNKAALMGIDYHQIPELLIAAWGPERPRKRVLAYQAAGRVAEQFRQRCLEYRLLDYSLQIELFRDLLAMSGFHDEFFSRYSYLVVEHMEEETAFTHDLILDWLPHVAGALLIHEQEAGYRVFLGADPEGVERIRRVCEGVMTLEHSYTTHAGLEALIGEIAYTLNRSSAHPVSPESGLAFSYTFKSFYPQMLDWVANKIDYLVHEAGIAPREIVVLAPYLSDALRFSLGQKLGARGIPSVSHRPSRALREEPAARTVLTLAALAHPAWGKLPPRDDVAHALQVAINGLDPVRARLLAKIVYRPSGDEVLTTFEAINPNMQSRITFTAGQRYEWLRDWLLQFAESDPVPLDHLFSQLFGELLSQPGFGFHTDPGAGRVVAELVESARKFRQGLYAESSVPLDEIGRRYYTVVEQGLLAALYVASWRDEHANAVFMAPAYTFLMRNRVADVQFWLDVGSTGWWERLDQPLTHPYVLSQRWEPGRLWTDADEFEHQQEMLYRLTSGLIRRCRREIYLGISDLGEQGYEQRGPLLRIVQGILRRHPVEEG